MKEYSYYPPLNQRLKEAWKTGMLYRFYAWLSKSNKKKEKKENEVC